MKGAILLIIAALTAAAAALMTGPAQTDKPQGQTEGETMSENGGRPSDGISLDGAWEPEGYVGPRAEIDGGRMIRLWNSSPVLETEFTVEEKDGKIILNLAENGLRNSPSDDPYAVVKECRYENGAIVFVDEFRFSGERVETLYPTTNSRYGDVTVISGELLPELEGRWVSDDFPSELRFKGGILEIGDDESVDYTVSVAAVRHNSGGWISIIDADPAVQLVGFFSSMRYENGVITAEIFVADAPSVRLTYVKK